MERDSAVKAIASVFLIWTALIIGLNWLDVVLPASARFAAEPLRFDNTGTFGDSFGVISALMTSIAAYFAYRAYRSSQEELFGARRRAGEPTFLNLLERRFTLVDQLASGNLKGLGVLSNITYNIREAVARGDQFQAAYDRYAKAQGVRGLRNMFRYTYHIIVFAEDLFGVDVEAKGAAKRNNGSYPYVRLLRAQLSDDELLLIALNSLCDPDGEEFKTLLDRYGLLDNMKLEDRRQFRLEEIFRGDEFGLPR